MKSPGSLRTPFWLSRTSSGAPWELLGTSWGGHNHCTGSMDRDFGALWVPLGALLTASLLSRGLQSSKIALRSSETSHKSRSIGPVNVSEPQGAQNSNSGGLEAAILDTFITFEASRGATTPFDPCIAFLIVGGLGPALQRSLDL